MMKPHLPKNNILSIEQQEVLKERILKVEEGRGEYKDAMKVAQQIKDKLKHIAKRK